MADGSSAAGAMEWSRCLRDSNSNHSAPNTRTKRQTNYAALTPNRFLDREGLLYEQGGARVLFRHAQHPLAKDG